MTEPRAPGAADRPPDQPAPPAPPAADASDREALFEHFLAYEARFSRESLSRAARDVGHDAETIDAAWRRVDGERAAVGNRDRYVGWARAIVVALYAATFLVLVVPTDMDDRTAGIGPAILAIVLLLTGLASLAVVGRRRRLPADPLAALAVLLAAPFVILVIVAGTCVWSTGPTFFPGPA